MYGRISYLNISLISWAIQQFNLRCLYYYSWVCSGIPLSALLQTVVSQHETNTYLRDFIIVRSILSRFIKNFIIISFSYLSFPPLFPLFQLLFVYLVISQIPTFLVHNCETSWRFYYFHLLLPLFVINSLWSPSMSLLGHDT